MADDKIAFQCARCGSAKFEIPTNPSPSDVVKCHGCGASTRYEVLQKKAVAMAKAHIEKTLKGFGKLTWR